MDIHLAEKIERLEAQLPRWEKWLYACFGAAVTMLGNSIARAFERSYLTAAFFKSLKHIEPAAFTENAPTILLTDPVSLNIQRALFAPYWLILSYFLLSAILIPAIWLAFHALWRQVPLAKRGDLIFGYFLAGWLTLLSLGVQDPFNADSGYNVLVISYLLALGLGYWWLRRKKDKAEEVFP
ncbi:MAG: hypothetical protein HRF47_15660 [Chloroflexota bacterium]|jgi:hypothetical protein